MSILTRGKGVVCTCMITGMGNARVGAGEEFDSRGPQLNRTGQQNATNFLWAITAVFLKCERRVSSSYAALLTQSDVD